MLHQFGAFGARSESPRKPASVSNVHPTKLVTPPRQTGQVDSDDFDEEEEEEEENEVESLYDVDEPDEDKENQGMEYIDIEAIENVSDTGQSIFIVSNSCAGRFGR